MSSAAKTNAGKIHPLTSLRFFAALMIVFFHSIPVVFPGFPPGELGKRWYSTWCVSVSFFYFLSGYILSVVYLSQGKPVDRRGFWSARFARIYPLFFLTLLMDVPNMLRSRILLYGVKKAVLFTGATFLYDTTMLQAWTPHLRIICGANWSLSVESLFYLLFPFVGPALWKLHGRKLWTAAPVIYAAGMTIVWLASRHFASFDVGINPAMHLTTFLMGILLARWQQDRRESPGWKEPGNWQVFAVLGIGVAGYLTIVANIGVHIEPLLVTNGMLAPVFACLIWAFSSSESVLARWFSVRWLVVLGEASYGLYLIHGPVWGYFEWFLPLRWIHEWFPFYLATAIGLSVLSFYFYETPARKRILRRLAVRPRETMEAASDAQ